MAAVNGRTVGDGWVFAIDAAPGCGQSGRSGGGGIVVIGANDLHGLVGEPSTPTCPGESADSAPQAQWLGSLAHQMGHAFGLPHPPGCDDAPSTCDGPALMWMGFRRYPAAIVGPSERAMLDRSPFFFATVPFGAFDTPADKAVVSGEVAVTGWVGRQSRHGARPVSGACCR